MKRDMDLIRDILIQIGDADDDIDTNLLIKGKTDLEKRLIFYHVEILHGKNLITGYCITTTGGDYWHMLKLTWDGNDFLSAIQDDDVWSSTKDGIQNAGAFTFDLVKDLARGFIKKKIEEHTGIKI